MKTTGSRGTAMYKGKEMPSIFPYAIDVYNDFARTMNKGISEKFNRAWDIVHPNWEYKDPDIYGDDEYMRAYYVLSAMVLEDIAVKHQRESGYYILLDPEESCTIESDFSKFWINIKELRKVKR